MIKRSYDLLMIPGIVYLFFKIHSPSMSYRFWLDILPGQSLTRSPLRLRISSYIVFRIFLKFLLGCSTLHWLNNGVIIHFILSQALEQFVNGLY